MENPITTTQERQVELRYLALVWEGLGKLADEYYHSLGSTNSRSQQYKLASQFYHRSRRLVEKFSQQGLAGMKKLK